MQDFIDEVDRNFSRFFASCTTDLVTVIQLLDEEEDAFKKSYRRLVSLQAWRSELIECKFDKKAAEFFKEAQNDALISHSLARQGGWRVALMAMRSCIENVLFGLYYCEHPVELQQWENGDHKLGFSETISYIKKHPNLSGIDDKDAGIDGLVREYATLSKAVHGSSRLFRMTKNGDVEGLNIHSLADFGAWQKREKIIMYYLNTLLVAFFNQDLQGASRLNLRKALSLVIPERKHRGIKDLYGVSLRSV